MADYFDDEFFIAPPLIERAPDSAPCGCHPEQFCQCDDPEETEEG